MFIQVITGTATDPEGLRRQSHRWQEDLRPGAAGYLGTTAGVTDDGRFILLARFESEAAARANSERPEQGAWWAETEKCLDRVAFLDSGDVSTLLGGGSDAAGFVQVMRGRVKDRQRMAALESRMPEFEAALRRARPDLLGELIAVHPDGTYTNAAYFASEAEARQAEGRELPADLKAFFDELMAAITSDEYFDLRDPWLQ